MLSKFFRVATEGLTVDGREITGQQIEEMAQTYNPIKYGARIWLEHYRSLFPDGAFAAHGDVIALKTGTDAQGKKILMAQLSPLASLLKMNSAGQKVYTSVEIHPNFQDTKKAYLMGLAVTDTPASVGTEMLQFSGENSDKFADAGVIKNHLYSSFIEADSIEFNEVDGTEDASDDKPKPSLLSQVMGILGKGKDESDAQYSDISGAVTEIAKSQDDLNTKFSDTGNTIVELSNSVSKLTSDLAATIEGLKQSPGASYTPRPPNDGSNGEELADC